MSSKDQSRRSNASETKDEQTSAKIHPEIEIDLTLLVFRRLIVTVVLGGFGLVGSALLLARHYNDPWLWRIAGSTAIICTARIAVVLAFTLRRGSSLTPYAARRWRIAYASATFLYCCSLAASTLYTFAYHDAHAQFLCTIGIFSFCAALGARIGLRPWIIQLCGFIMLGALAVSVLRLGDLLDRTAFVLVCFFAYIHWESVQNKFDIVLEQLHSRRRLRDLALHDALTGLANRRHFEDRLAHLCSGSTSFGVLYMDLDRFKQINDTFGHATGDLLLQCVADRLRSVIRSDQDLLARLGGDEFAILQTSVTEENAPQTLAARIHHALREPLLIEGLQLGITASIGARVATGSYNNPRILLGRADAALYRVKQAGGAAFALAED